MAADLQDVRTRATQFANGFTPGQKAMSTFALIAALVGGLVYFHIAGKPSYQPLFTGLKSSDASSITTKLSSAGVPYQLADGGATVLVPGKDVNSERLAMSAAGLPAQGGGFSNLDKQGLTSSSASQQAAYQSDLQGELDSTIESIQGVTSAQVAIALPQTDTFGVSTNSATTASVLVGLGARSSLTGTQVTSIVHLVASAVPALNPSNVTVADTNGNILAAPGVNTASSGGGCQAKAFDNNLSTSLDQLLQTVAGPGNVQVQVAGTLDCNTSTINSQSVQTAKNGKPIAVPTSKSSDSEIYSGTGATGTGSVIGTTTAPATTTTTGAGAYTKKDSSQLYAVGTVNKTIKQAPGTIQKLQVAVLLNTKANVNPATVKTLVSSAAGIQASRGDKVTVVSMPFSTSTATAAAAAAKAAAKAKKSAGLLSIGRTALLVIGLIVLILLLLRSSKKERRTAVALPYDGPQQLLAAHQASLVAAAARPAIGSGPTGAAADLNDFIDSSPDEIADLLRSWTREDSRS